MHARRRAMHLHCSCEMQICGREAGGDGAWSRTASGRGQPSIGSKSHTCLGLKHRLEAENAVLGSPGILPCNPPALAWLFGWPPRAPSGESKGSDWETLGRAGERKGISHKQLVRALSA